MVCVITASMPARTNPTARIQNSILSSLAEDGAIKILVLSVSVIGPAATSDKILLEVTGEPSKSLLTSPHLEQCWLVSGFAVRHLKHSQFMGGGRSGSTSEGEDGFSFSMSPAAGGQDDFTFPRDEVP
jgi:hypothetical protein